MVVFIFKRLEITTRKLLHGLIVLTIRATIKMFIWIVKNKVGRGPIVILQPGSKSGNKKALTATVKMESFKSGAVSLIFC